MNPLLYTVPAPLLHGIGDFLELKDRRPFISRSIVFLLKPDPIILAHLSLDAIWKTHIMKLEQF